MEYVVSAWILNLSASLHAHLESKPRRYKFKEVT